MMTTANAKTKILLIDMDGGCDDAVAIAMPPNEEGVEVVGITSVMGNVTASQAHTNVGVILKQFGKLESRSGGGRSLSWGLRWVHLARPREGRDGGQQDEKPTESEISWP